MSLPRRLLIVGAFTLAGLWAVPPARTVVSGASQSSDLDLFSAIISRARGGEAYYEAYGMELRVRGYPGASVFNWRPPLLYRMLAWFGLDAGRWVLSALIMLLILAALLTIRTTALAPRIVTIAGLSGALAPAVGAQAVLVTDVWAGVLLGLSSCAYLGARRPAGAALALVAAAIRELAAPYAFVALVLSLRDRARAEQRVWAIGGALLALYASLHIFQVLQHQRPDDLAHSVSWLYFGGVRFLLATIRVNPLFDNMLAGAALGAIIVALSARCTPRHLRWTSGIYVVGFLMIGQPVNDYWGYVTAPLWAFAIGRALDFGKASRGIPDATRPSVTLYRPFRTVSVNEGERLGANASAPGYLA